MNTSQPYELHTHGGGAFVSFDSMQGDVLSLPLISLNRAILRTRGQGSELVLEFEANLVSVFGNNLASLRDHLLAGRLKVIRVGQFEECSVTGIRVSDS
jgi:hypothetical protein